MMPRVIYTYTDLKKLPQAPFWEELRRIPQITASTSLRKSLTGSLQYDRVEGLLRNDPFFCAADFYSLAALILPGWSSEETRFRELVVLSRFLRNRIAKTQPDDEARRWLIGCRRNLGMLLTAVTRLEEAAVSPDDFDAADDRNLSLLLEAWRYLRENDPAAAAFHKSMDVLSKRQTWEGVFLRLFGRAEAGSLVFHGFFNITPLQERLMHLLEEAGYRLIFLFPYNAACPAACEIWRRTYAVENGFPPLTEWHTEESAEADPCGELFEGRKSSLTSKLEIREYASVMEFVQDIRRVREDGYTVYAPDAQAANALLMDFYPEEYGERRLLSYPIGQFVSVLNELWDEDAGEIRLTGEQLIECFSSGWLALDGVSGKSCIRELVDILPFFADCRRLTEWEERLEYLEAVRKEITSVFLREHSPDIRTARWQEVLEQPFRNFSVFAVPEEKLHVLLSLIRRVIAMARDLFDAGPNVRIEEHIAKLDRILRSYELSAELYEEEREILKNLFKKLQTPSGLTSLCAPSDIAGALNLWLSGRMKDEELQGVKLGLVSPLYFIDAEAAKPEGRVHICFCDVNHMPGGLRAQPWPLTKRSLSSCMERSGNPLLKNMIGFSETVWIANRYFLYSGLRNSGVQLSWISAAG